jgi:hypothetical protein
MARFLALLLLAACTEGEGDDTGDPDDTGDSGSELPDAPSPPMVRGVHLAPGLASGCDLDGDTGTTADQYAACIVLFVGEGQVPIDDAAFPFGASSGFLPLPITGDYMFHAVPYNTFLADPTHANTSGSRVASFPLNVLPETVQTFVAYGHPAYSNTGLLIADDDLTPPTANKARIRVFHAYAASAASPDVTIASTIAADALAYATFSTPIEIDPADDVMILVDLQGDADPDLVALFDATADTSYDLFIVNVPPTSVPSGFLGFLHTVSVRLPPHPEDPCSRSCWPRSPSPPRPTPRSRSPRRRVPRWGRRPRAGPVASTGSRTSSRSAWRA